MQLSTLCRNAPILRESEAEQMNKGILVPTFELPEHGKLRVKSEIGELQLLCASFTYMPCLVLYTTRIRYIA